MGNELGLGWVPVFEVWQQLMLASGLPDDVSRLEK